MAHLDQVHEAIVTVLQEVDAELAQKEAYIQGRASRHLRVLCHLLPLGHAPHSLTRVMRILLKLPPPPQKKR